MWTMKSTIRLFVSAWLLCLLLACGSSVQAEAMYQISESELTTLEQNLQTLEAHSSQKQELLNQQQKQLAEAQTQLETANRQLEKSRELNKQTQKSLDRANQSLKQFEDEAKRKIRVKTRQRNLWIAISGGLLYAWIKK